MSVRSRSWALVSATVLVLSAAIAALGPAAAVASETGKIDWTPCHQELGPTFECGTLQVPLEYSSRGNQDSNSNEPQQISNSRDGRQISIAVARLLATDQRNRIGSIFINPGGPGGSGVDFVLFAGPFLFSADVRAKFDIVGFDPRGIFRSTQLQCFGSPAEWAPFFLPFAFPSNAAEEKLQKAADAFLAGACAERGGRIIDHMSTANVARDLDMLRAAVGDTRLTYAGYSYGSYLGVTYANLFPGRVRALIVDGVLDPIAWSTGTRREGDTVPFSTRLRSDQGAQATLQEFFRLCDAGTGCAFAPNSAQRFAALGERLKASPLQLIDPATGQVIEFNYSLLILNTLFAMYASESWPFLAAFLADLEAIVGPAQLGASLDALRETIGLNQRFADPTYRNNLEGFPGVACSDSDNPDSYKAWSRQGALADEQFGYFGRIWTWVSSICAAWPGTDSGRYLGPFTRTTANPVLVIGNQFDPATRYQGAVTVSGLLPRSRLLTVHGWGHTSLFRSQCADAAVAAYLLRMTLPATGTVCEQDFIPFVPTTLALQQSSSSQARVRGQLIPSGLARSGH